MDVADQDLPPHPGALQAFRSLESDALRYRESSPAVRPAIAGHCRRWFHWEPDAAEIVTFPVGAKTAVQIAVEACTDRGAAVVIPTPMYSGILKVASVRGRNTVLTAHSSGNDGDFSGQLRLMDALLEGSHRAAIIIANPSNPSGRVWRPEELECLDKVAYRHGSCVIVDEVHSDLVWEPHKHVPFGASPRSARWIVIGSVSKAFNVGGVGWCWALASDPELRLSMLEVTSRMGLYEGSTLGDLVATSCLADQSDWLNLRREELYRRTLIAVEHLRTQASGWEVCEPEAGFLLWCKVARDDLRDDAANWLWESTSIRGLSGARFSERDQRWIRLNVALHLPVLEEALARIAAASRQ